ncbi:hypothetical protein LSH36_94g01023 [Paralvinella palmiformis]|uniref:CB1 cannabinoid receptor-interacting protein 1 n=1 Tax=Paralvinella palmiformis TaxID=53620 RepID=A0AAD9NCY9_9ANNE|nr:hypothetical protein LSH36_94g01023 [Paralvinella palmiformis]
MTTTAQHRPVRTSLFVLLYPVGPQTQRAPTKRRDSLGVWANQPASQSVGLWISAARSGIGCDRDPDAATMAQYVKVQFNVKKRPYDQPIHFKMDGGRFDMDRTVKLNVNAKYTFDITLRPPKDVDQFTIQGQEVQVTQKQKDLEAVVYRGEWLTTGLEKCKKGIRNKLHITLKIRGMGELSSTLQVKLYSESEKEHSHWGSVLNVLEYECQAGEGQGQLEITKETFR